MSVWERLFGKEPVAHKVLQLEVLRAASEAAADRQKGRLISYPKWSALLVPIPGTGRMLPAHPLTSLGMSSALARPLSQFVITHHQLLPLYQLRNSTKIIPFQRENCWDGEECLCVWIYDPGDCKLAGPQPCKWSKRTVGHNEYFCRDSSFSKHSEPYLLCCYLPRPY